MRQKKRKETGVPGISPAGGGQSALLRGAPRERGPDLHRARATWGPLHTTRGPGPDPHRPGARGVLCIPHGRAGTDPYRPWATWGPLHTTWGSRDRSA